MKSSLLTLPGAVPAEGVDDGVAAHYGELYREQRWLAAGHGFVDLSHRGVLTVTGADRLSWLHLLITQHVSELPPHRAVEGLVLSAHGHVEHALYLVDDGETTWVHVEPGTAPALREYLDSMRFFYRVEVTDRTEDVAVVSLPAGSIVETPNALAVRQTAHGRDVFLPRAELLQHAKEWGEPVGTLAYEALRVEEQRPRLGFETDHRTIPHEVGWLDTAVHLDKGCYRGQETVARVHNLGKPPRRLVFLHLDGTEVVLPPHGAEIRKADAGVDSRPVGFLTTSARHHELGPIALALVKRNTDPEATLLADAVPANQEVVVPR